MSDFIEELYTNAGLIRQIAGSGTPPPDPIPEPEPSGRMWHPGNYIEITDSSQWDTPNNNNPRNRGAKQRFLADKNGCWDGLMERYGWPNLEAAQDDYDTGINKIRTRLNQLAELGNRKLLIFVGLKTFGQGTHSVPQYMRNNAKYSDGTNYNGSGNGEYIYASDNGGPGGTVPNIHVPACAARLDAMMAAYAEEFNGHPNFEGLVYSEASINSPLGSPDNWIDSNTGGNAWFGNMLEAFILMRTKWDKHQICQWINAPRSKMKTWVPDLREAGIGLGMTDACPEEKGFNYRSDLDGYASTPPGNIQHCQQSNGKAIIIAHASKPARDGVVVGRGQTQGTIQGQPHVYPTYPGDGISTQKLRDFMVNVVGSTHNVWIHNTGSYPMPGTKDPNGPASQDPYNPYDGYGGRGYNEVADEFMFDPDSVIGTKTARPDGW